MATKKTEKIGNPREGAELVSVKSMKTLNKAIFKIYEAVDLVERSYMEQKKFAGRIKKDLKRG